MTLYCFICNIQLGAKAAADQKLEDALAELDDSKAQVQKTSAAQAASGKWSKLSAARQEGEAGKKLQRANEARNAAEVALSEAQAMAAEAMSRAQEQSQLRLNAEKKHEETLATLEGLRAEQLTSAGRGAQASSQEARLDPHFACEAVKNKDTVHIKQ